jgi:predicted HD phosphohydrolase
MSGKTNNQGPATNNVTSRAAARPAGQSAAGVVELLSGRWIDVLNPQVEDIHLPDIAGGLAKICRFQGQTSTFYSVAEHSVLCALLAQQQQLDDHLVRAAFLHDAHEAYLGDITTPIKLLIPGIENISSRLDQAVAEYFSVDVELFGAPEIRDIDHTALSLEAHQFMSLTTPGFKEVLKPVEEHPEDLSWDEVGFAWDEQRSIPQSEQLFQRTAEHLGLAGQ